MTEFIFTAKSVIDASSWSKNFTDYWVARQRSRYYAELEDAVTDFHKRTGLAFHDIEMVQFGPAAHEYYLRKRETQPIPPPGKPGTLEYAAHRLGLCIEVLKNYSIGEDGQQAIFCLKQEILPWIQDAIKRESTAGGTSGPAPNATPGPTNPTPASPGG